MNTGTTIAEIARALFRSCIRLRLTDGSGPMADFVCLLDKRKREAEY